ncbi:MAG: TIGR03619 family F420-dependent LLM class oxidoreductase [Alphaproteobacteria bacterium]|nr:TIGR03619 family F420-dependent LLM class oxidoreductase [Alphaproteobacteria bacterium]
MRFSCRCPNTDYLGFEASPEAIVATAKKAEELGYDAIFVNDHIIVDSSPRAANWTNCYDPFVALATIAAHTNRIRLGVSVLIVPYRNPIATAKGLATIDRMSAGRLIAGVGVGWNEAEFAALGVPYRERGVRTDEYLRVWQACWSPGLASFDGKFATFAEMHVNPKPVQQHPPFWVGGLSDAALRRAAAIADVWQPTPTRGDGASRTGGGITHRLEENRPRRPAGNPHELSRRTQQHSGQDTARRRKTPGRARHTGRGRRRSDALSRDRRALRVPDQFPRQSRPVAAPRFDGVLQARRSATSDLTA